VSAPVARCAIFIPAYNAGATLADVIARVPADSWPAIAAVWVIDDGSTDDTAAVAEELAATHPEIRLLRHERNRGYGAAVRSGLSACRDSDADFVVCLHSDGQYPPEQVPAFIDHMAVNGVDVLQGSRHLDGTALRGGMPYYKYLAGKVLTWMENRTFGLRMTDYHSGFLIYSRRAVERIPFDDLSYYFDFDLEVIASARSRSLSIGELGIATRYGDETSHLNPIYYGLRCLRVMVRYRLGRY